jgi:hypothetical protein
MAGNLPARTCLRMVSGQFLSSLAMSSTRSSSSSAVAVLVIRNATQISFKKGDRVRHRLGGAAHDGVGHLQSPGRHNRRHQLRVVSGHRAQARNVRTRGTDARARRGRTPRLSTPRAGRSIRPSVRGKPSPAATGCRGSRLPFPQRVGRLGNASVAAAPSLTKQCRALRCGMREFRPLGGPRQARSRDADSKGPCRAHQRQAELAFPRGAPRASPRRLHGGHVDDGDASRDVPQTRRQHGGAAGRGGACADQRLFRDGLCGAVRCDLTVAVPPRFDWVGRFSQGRAAVRLGGL